MLYTCFNEQNECILCTEWKLITYIMVVTNTNGKIIFQNYSHYTKGEWLTVPIENIYLCELGVTGFPPTRTSKDPWLYQTHNTTHAAVLHEYEKYRLLHEYENYRNSHQTSSSKRSGIKIIASTRTSGCAEKITKRKCNNKHEQKPEKNGRRTRRVVLCVRRGKIPVHK